MIVFTAKIIVLVTGSIIILAAAWGLFATDRLVALVKSTLNQRWGIYFAVAVRLILGAALIGVAASSLFPVAFQALGIITILAALALLLAGRQRVRDFVEWWSGKFSTPMIRLWLLVGIAFAAFLLYGVL